MNVLPLEKKYKWVTFKNDQGWEKALIDGKMQPIVKLGLGFKCYLK